jgi:hypothetical protein
MDVADHAAVEFDLLFARAAAHAGAAGLAFQVRPAPHQPRAEVLQAGQLDLQLAFVAARALREDLQDQQGAVVDRQAEVALEVALLRRAERLVEQHLGGAVLLGQRLDLVGLALADEQRGVGRLALGGDAGDGLQAGGLASSPSSASSPSKWGRPEVDPDQDGRRGGTGDWVSGKTASGGIQNGNKPGAWASRARGPQVWRLRRLGRGEVHRPTRHDGGDGVLVDHLGHGVAQQHDVLVERFDLALQLDAVDEVDRDRHVLASQRVQEGVL